MRVTNSMMSSNFLRDMNTNMENLSNLQGQMTSGKEIRKPSDDPFKASRAMQLNTDLNTNTQYSGNISDTTNWLDTTDTALGQVGDVLQRMRELLVSVGDPGYGPDEQASVKSEINQKIGELSQIINTNYDGRYVFGGTKGTSKPVAEATVAGNSNLFYSNKTGAPISPAMLDPITNLPILDASNVPVPDPQYSNQYNMINSKLTVEISQGVTMQYNVNAADINNIPPNPPAATHNDLFTILGNITTDLTNNSTANVTGQDLSDITDAISNVLKLRSEVGAKTNRMESAQTKNQDDSANMTEILSKTEDIDITQKTMEYATMQTVYTASLQTSAKILQPTLMDYLK
jgi:flagellar hook-associated protein 3 FlgL